ncbi:hypothetical protein BKA70DRAFT_1576820 [Coprinopsis sp. MPI-PUGE-AT-0042]|nr:hypothetical protein BKA70DRAFT_1576820 [Coprinopsis sp. MPI-PUGE-AT-0042]
MTSQRRSGTRYHRVQMLAFCVDDLWMQCCIANGFTTTSELLQAFTSNHTCLACVYHRHVYRPLLPMITQWLAFLMLHSLDQAVSTSEFTGHNSTRYCRMTTPHGTNQHAGLLH